MRDSPARERPGVSLTIAPQQKVWRHVGGQLIARGVLTILPPPTTETASRAAFGCGAQWRGRGEGGDREDGYTAQADQTELAQLGFQCGRGVWDNLP
jgi:hypothetical protein